MPTTCFDDDGGSILKGHAVCLSGWDAINARPKVKRANAANLGGANAKTVYGIARSNSSSLAVDILVSGEVADVSISGLNTGPGTARLVVTDYDNTTIANQCRLRHIDDAPAVRERFIVGSSDESGTLVIQPRHSSLESGFQTVFNVRAYGAKGDGITDDTAAIRAAIVAAKAAQILFANRCGSIVEFPPGIYLCKFTVLVDGSVWLRGAHGGAYGSSIIRFDQDIDGPLIHVKQISADGTTVGNWTKLSGLYIRQENNGQRDYTKLSIGIKVDAHGVQMEDLMIYNIQGDGIEINGSPPANANYWGMRGNIRIQECDRYAFRPHGSNANGGCQEGTLELTGNESHGVFEGSFLGNSYDVIGTEGNGHTVQNGVWVHNFMPLPSANIWSPGKAVTKGRKMLPTVANRNGWQFRSLNAGTTGLVEPVWPTTQGALVLDGDVTFLCYAEEGVPYCSTGANSPKLLKWPYKEGDQAPSIVRSPDVIMGGQSFDIDPNGCMAKFGFNAGHLMPFEARTQRRLSYDVNLARPVTLKMGDITDPNVGFGKSAQGVPDVGPWQQGFMTFRDYWHPEMGRWVREAWPSIFATTPSALYRSYTEGDRGGPFPGAIAFQRVWLGSKIGQEVSITAQPASAVSPYRPTFNINGAAGILNAGLGWGVFRPGAICVNVPIPGRPSVPFLWRAKTIGSQNATYTRVANREYPVGVTIVTTSPTLFGDALYCVKTPGKTANAASPAFPNVPGTLVTDGTLVWEWCGIYVSDDTASNIGLDFWETLLTTLPTTFTKDVSAGGTITLDLLDAACERLKFTGVLPGNTVVIVPPGPALGWTKTVENATTGPYTLTIRSTVGGVGGVVFQNTRALLDSDAFDVVAL